MKIAVLGAGSVGEALGRRFAEAGHAIVYGVPTPGQKHRDLAASIGHGATVTTVAEASRDAEVVVLAVPWEAAEAALVSAGDLAGKIVVDCTNPLAAGPDGFGLTEGFDTSGGERVAAWASGARVVKCFNQTGSGNMADPLAGGIRSVQFVCGDDAGARETVRRLAEEIGFDAIDVGAMKQARLLEPLAMLWIHLAFTTPLGRDFVFAVIRK